MYADSTSERVATHLRDQVVGLPSGPAGDVLGDHLGPLGLAEHGVRLWLRRGEDQPHPLVAGWVGVCGEAVELDDRVEGSPGRSRAR